MGDLRAMAFGLRARARLPEDMTVCSCQKLNVFFLGGVAAKHSHLPQNERLIVHTDNSHRRPANAPYHSDAGHGQRTVEAKSQDCERNCHVPDTLETKEKEKEKTIGV